VEVAELRGQLMERQLAPPSPVAGAGNGGSYEDDVLTRIDGLVQVRAAGVAQAAVRSWRLVHAHIVSSLRALTCT